MSCNTRTAVLKPDKTFKIFNGWYALASSDKVYVSALPSIPRSKAKLLKTKGNAYYLEEATLSIEKILQKVELSTEDRFFPFEETEETEEWVNVVKLHSKDDGNIYYLFHLGENEHISFSPEFKVFLDTWIENSYSCDQYERIVYASLPEDVPLIVDIRNTICISPLP